MYSGNLDTLIIYQHNFVSILYVTVNTFQSCWDRSNWIEPERGKTEPLRTTVLLLQLHDSYKYEPVQDAKWQNKLLPNVEKSHLPCQASAHAMTSNFHPPLVNFYF